jgi:ATP-binding cassette subfamily F protein 1
MDAKQEKMLKKVLLKVEEGRKLTNKEKKLYKDYLDTHKPPFSPLEDEKLPPEHDLTDFSLVTRNKAVSDGRSIKLEGFSITVYGKQLFNDTDLKVAYPRRYGLIGHNGLGKSTLIKHIAERAIPIPEALDLLYVEQEVPATELSVIDTVLSANRERTELLLKQKKLLTEIEDVSGTISEELFSTLRDVEDELVAIESDKEVSIAKKVLHGLGFTDIDAPTSSFSGGWRMRISIAKALYRRPTLLMLDEPTSHLDLNAVIWLTNYLSKWKRSLIVVSHDRCFLNMICQEIIEIRDQQLHYFTGNYDRYEREMADRRKKGAKEWKKLEKKIEQMRKKNTPRSQINDYIKKSGIVRPEKEYRMPIKFPSVSEVKGSLISFEDVSFSYTSTTPTIFEDLTFGIRKEDRIVFVGENGVGKSTLLKLIASKLTPTAGTVTTNDRLRIGYYDQHVSDALPLDKTPIEHLLSVNGSLTEHDVRKELGIIGLAGSDHKRLIGKLSGGQKVRVALIQLMLDRPNMLLLDEVTNYLDMESIDSLITAINNYEGAVIMVSHDMDLILRSEAQLWMCQDKTIIQDISWNDYCYQILDDE